jgi:hypothetical protein
VLYLGPGGGDAHAWWTQDLTVNEPRDEVEGARVAPEALAVLAMAQTGWWVALDVRVGDMVGESV